MNEFSIIIVTLIASAFFSGMEIAFFASDKLRLELDKGKTETMEKLSASFTAILDSTFPRF